MTEISMEAFNSWACIADGASPTILSGTSASMLSASRLTNGRCRHSQMAEELIVEAVIWDFVVAGFPVVDVKVDLIDGKYQTSTLRRWRSRSLRVRHFAKRSIKRGRCCSRRS